MHLCVTSTDAKYTQAQSDRWKVFHQSGATAEARDGKEMKREKPRNYAYTAQFHWDYANVIDTAYGMLCTDRIIICDFRSIKLASNGQQRRPQNWWPIKIGGQCKFNPLIFNEKFTVQNEIQCSVLNESECHSHAFNVSMNSYSFIANSNALHSGHIEIWIWGPNTGNKYRR